MRRGPAAGEQAEEPSGREERAEARAVSLEERLRTATAERGELVSEAVRAASVSSATAEARAEEAAKANLVMGLGRQATPV